jgi:hypothetical protein
VSAVIFCVHMVRFQSQSCRGGVDKHGLLILISSIDCEDGSTEMNFGKSHSLPILLDALSYSVINTLHDARHTMTFYLVAGLG